MMRQMLAVTVACAATVFAYGCSKEASPPANPGPAVALTTIEAALKDVAEPIDVGGVVRATRTAAISSRIMAEVRSVRVTPGDRVRAGQALVVLDGRDLEANRSRAASAETASRQAAPMAGAERQSAVAMLALAKLTHQRLSDLRARNSATQGELDEAVAALRSAEARAAAADARVLAASADIDAAKAALDAASAAASYATLVAPFDGTVTEKSVEPGNMVSPGQTLMTVEHTQAFRLEVRLDSSQAALVNLGDAATVSIASARPAGAPDAHQGLTLEGRVSEVAQTVSPDSHDVLIKIDLPAGALLRSGMYGHARFRGRSHRVLTVQASAVVHRGQLTFVYVVDRDNRARLRLVNAGDPDNGSVEIRSGVAAGERIALAPPPALADGSPVAAGVR
ncbi:MAG: efflux RND transporter periplasmic adaptor subunit [Acidobacteriota bacterium]